MKAIVLKKKSPKRGSQGSWRTEHHDREWLWKRGWKLYSPHPESSGKDCFLCKLSMALGEPSYVKPNIWVLVLLFFNLQVYEFSVREFVPNGK